MRIALVHYTFPPVIGGVERVTEEHAMLFADAGHEVTLLCGNPGVAESSTRTVSIPLLSGAHPEVITAQAETPFGTAFEKIRSELEFQLASHLSHQDIVFLHNVCTMPFNLPLTAALAKMPVRFPRTRFVCWIHDIAAINPDYSIPLGGPWDLLRRRLPGFSYVAVSPKRQAEWCSLTASSPEDCPVIPNGFNPVRDLNLTPLAEELVERGILDRQLVLLHPCRLLRRKNVELSLHIIKSLREAGQDATLLITGATDPHHAPSAEYVAEIIALRDELELKKDVLFLGDLAPVLDGDMPSIYQLADAVLLPSRQEGFGLPMLEAAVHRIPAFCADIEPLRSLPGAIPFSLDLPPKDIAAMMIHQIRHWPANQPRKTALRHYSWPAIYRNYLDPFLRRANNHLH